MKKRVKQELEKILEKNKWKSIDDIGWGWEYLISRKEKLSEDFIREFQDKLDWWWISNSQVMSENLMRSLQDKINWEESSIYQKFSENFMREFKDKIDWWQVSYYQDFSSFNFIYEFRDDLYLDVLERRGIITEDDIENISRPLDRSEILYRNRLMVKKKITDKALKDLIALIFEGTCIHINQYNNSRLGSDWHKCQGCILRNIPFCIDKLNEDLCFAIWHRNFLDGYKIKVPRKRRRKMNNKYTLLDI